ncbi:MAG: MFS transporter [Pseudomonadota bacterium]
MIALLFAGLASIAMANSMVFPLLGPLGRSVGLSDGQIGAMHAAAAVGAIAAAPWWGRQADRYGRRTVFALSLLGLAVSTFLLVVGLGAARAALIDAPQSFALLLAARLAYGVLASGALPAAAGYLADISDAAARRRTMTLPSRAFSIGGIAGLLLIWPASALMGELGPLLLVMAIAAMIAGCALLPIVRRAGTAEMTPPEGSASARFDRIGHILAINTLAFTALSMVQVTVPFYLQDHFRLSTDTTISAATALSLLLTLATLAGIRVAARDGISIAVTAALGLLLAGIGIAGMFLAGSIAVLLLGHLSIGFGLGLFTPSTQAMLSLASSAGVQSHAAGLLSAAATSGYVLGPLAGGYLYARYGACAFLVAAALLAVVALGILLRASHNQQSG